MIFCTIELRYSSETKASKGVNIHLLLSSDDLSTLRRSSASYQSYLSGLPTTRFNVPRTIFGASGALMTHPLGMTRPLFGLA